MAPAPWSGCAGTTPDTQPGQGAVTYPPFHGQSYVGLQCAIGVSEGCSQQLSTPMMAGNTYRISLRLRGGGYIGTPNAGNLCIYGGSTNCSTTQLLWQSITGQITTSAWNLFQISLNPNSDYSYITFVACDIGSVHIDSISYIQQSLLSTSMDYQQSAKAKECTEISAHFNTDQSTGHFSLERSINGSQFQTIQSFYPDNKQKNFLLRYIDCNKLDELKYYRIRQFDSNGYESLYPIMLQKPLIQQASLVIDEERQLHINILEEAVNLSIYNTSGQVVKKTKSLSGNTLNLNDLAAGIYCVQISGQITNLMHKIVLY